MLLILLIVLLLLLFGGGYYGAPEYPYRSPLWLVAFVLLVLLLVWGVGGPRWGWYPLW